MIAVTTILLFLSIRSLTKIKAQDIGRIANSSTQFPFFAAIHRSHTPGNYSFDDVVCSAGILSSRKILTTCSCLHIFYGEGQQATDKLLYYPFNYYVSMGIGQTGVSQANMSSITIGRVVEIDYHQSCSQDERTGLTYGDLALLTLNNQIDFNSRIQPMPIPQLDMFKSSKVFKELANNRSLSCVALAWSKSSPELVALDVRLLPMAECVDHCTSYVQPLLCLIRNHVSGFMIKTAKPLNESTVFTGGPLVCNGTVWAMVNLKWRCSQGLYHQITSPTEVIFAAIDFQMSQIRKNIEMLTKRFSHPYQHQSND